MLLAYHIGLQDETSSFMGTKISGAANLTNSPALTPDCLTRDLRSIHELRGCVNRWSNTGRIRKRVAAPINQMVNTVEATGILVRRHEWGNGRISGR